MQIDRRGFMAAHGAAIAGLAVVGAGAAAARIVRAQEPPEKGADAAGRWPGFPQQDPSLVREMVGVSHSNPQRVRELLDAHPELAKATIDWGFGDWETALGAASHVGNKEIATMLLAAGARLDVFAAAMLGMGDVVKAILAADPALAKVRGPHGIPLAAHAVAGKNEALAAEIRAIAGPREVPFEELTPEQMKAYIGVYEREDATGKVTISQTKFGMAIKGDGGTDRTLVRLAEHMFHPAGCPSVHVRFTVREGRAVRVEVVSGTWFVAAGR